MRRFVPGEIQHWQPEAKLAPHGCPLDGVGHRSGQLTELPGTSREPLGALFLCQDDSRMQMNTCIFRHVYANLSLAGYNNGNRKRSTPRTTALRTALATEYRYEPPSQFPGFTLSTHNTPCFGSKQMCSDSNIT